MPKLKSHKGASKRFKKTAGGKVKRGHSGLRHMLSSKAKKRKKTFGQGNAGKRRRSPQSKADDSVPVEALPQAREEARDRRKARLPCLQPPVQRTQKGEKPCHV